jgi:hypothetical protein
MLSLINLLLVFTMPLPLKFFVFEFATSLNAPQSAPKVYGEEQCLKVRPEKLRRQEAVGMGGKIFNLLLYRDLLLFNHAVSL